MGTAEAPWVAIAHEMAQDSGRTLHHGRPGLPAAAKMAWANRLQLAAGETAQLTAARWLAAQREPDLREVASVLLGGVAPDPDAEALLWALASDEDWEVREWAVAPLAGWCRTAQDTGQERLARWMAGGARPRRAALLAIRELVADGSLDAGAGLQLVETALDDNDPYVVENLGSYVLGDGFLRHAPAATLAWLRDLNPSELTAAWPRHLARLIKSKAAQPWRRDLEPVVRQALPAAPPRTATALTRWLDAI
jgi:hypothetical protein